MRPRPAGGGRCVCTSAAPATSSATSWAALLSTHRGGAAVCACGMSARACLRPRSRTLNCVGILMLLLLKCNGFLTELGSLLRPAMGVMTVEVSLKGDSSAAAVPVDRSTGARSPACVSVELKPPQPSPTNVDGWEVVRSGHVDKEAWAPWRNLSSYRDWCDTNKWQPRWLTLLRSPTRAAALCISVHPFSPSSPRAETEQVPLRGARCCVCDTTRLAVGVQSPHAFVVHSRTRDYYFTSPSAEACSEWVAAISASLEECSEARPATGTVPGLAMPKTARLAGKSASGAGSAESRGGRDAHASRGDTARLRAALGRPRTPPSGRTPEAGRRPSSPPSPRSRVGSAGAALCRAPAYVSPLRQLRTF